MKFRVLLYYFYAPVPDPAAEQAAQLALCAREGLLGRIIIGGEGLNGTVAGTPSAVQAYMAYLGGHPLFRDTQFKIDETDTIPFRKLKIKVRSEIVTLGEDVDVSRTAPHVSPQEFQRLLADDEVVLFDARNGYESAIGRFKGAITPDTKTFKDFPAALDDYEHLKDKKIVTYCTGGIRCEKASALMKQRGFTNVYQLDGGIINYAKQYPDGAFEGECFVFDERMKVAFQDAPKQLGTCSQCSAPTNSYRNCSDVTCHELMTVCAACWQKKTLCVVGQHVRLPVETP